MPAAVYSHGAESSGKSIHWPRKGHQSVFDGSWQHNYYCQQRQAGRANEQSISLMSMVISLKLLRAIEDNNFFSTKSFFAPINQKLLKVGSFPSMSEKVFSLV